jgi:hypothetical protein
MTFLRATTFFSRSRTLARLGPLPSRRFAALAGDDTIFLEATNKYANL